MKGLFGLAGRRMRYGDGREALVEATIRLVARAGLSKVSYRSLAAEAGVTHGVVQHHFGSIDDLLREALSRCLETALEQLKEPEEPGQMFGHLVRVLIDDPESAAFQAEVFLEARRRPVLMDMVVEHRQAYRRHWVARFAELGVKVPENVLEVLLATLDGVVYAQIVSGAPDRAKLELQLDGLRELLADYLFGVGDPGS